MDSTMRCKHSTWWTYFRTHWIYHFLFHSLFDLHFLFLHRFLNLFSTDYLCMFLPHLFSCFTLNSPTLFSSTPSGYFYTPLKSTPISFLFPPLPSPVGFFLSYSHTIYWSTLFLITFQVSNIVQNNIIDD